MKYIVFLCWFVSFVFSSDVLEFRKYDFLMIKDRNTYLVSEKYDGIRAIWDGKQLKTKRGNVIYAPRCFVENLPNFSLDGELWIGYNRFSEIQSLVAREDSTCEDWREVKYMIFDSPVDCCKDCDYNELSCSVLGRLERVREFVVANPNMNLVLIKQIVFYKNINFDKEIQDLLDEIISKGGEGLIIRDNNEPYKIGRSEVSFKLKRENDAECEVVGYTEGKGKFHGKVGAIICKQQIMLDSDLSAKDWEIFRKQCDGKKEPCRVEITFKIGSGLSDELRANPPKIGDIITYKYNGFTHNGIPRHSVFVRRFKEY